MLTFDTQRHLDAHTQSWLVHLFESAFPPEERRRTTQLLDLIESGRTTCHTAYYNGECAAFLTEWNLGDFRYGEYFAVDADMRGQNIGSATMQHVLSLSQQPFVLEVELPDTDIARRRIAFYERIGFVLCEKHYLQPPYNEGFPAVPLRLMEYGGQLTKTDFDQVAHTLHRVVYNQTNV